MQSKVLTSFTKRCSVPTAIQMVLKNSVLKLQGPLGTAELQLKTYDKKGGFSMKLVQQAPAHQELYFRTHGEEGQKTLQYVKFFDLPLHAF